MTVVYSMWEFLARPEVFASLLLVDVYIVAWVLGLVRGRPWIVFPIWALVINIYALILKILHVI